MPIYNRSRSLPETVADIDREVADFKDSQRSGFDIFVPKINTIDDSLYDVVVTGKGFANGEFFTVRFEADNQTEPNSRIFMSVYTNASATTPANPDELFLTAQLELEDSSNQDGVSEWFINFYILDSAPFTTAYGKIYVIGSDEGTVSIV
jgi:hypothetical protein